MAVNPHIRLACSVGWELQKDATPARQPIQCVVRTTYADGYEAEVAATATAWSKQAVQVCFPHPDPAVSGPVYRIWVSVERVRRLPGVSAGD